MIKFKSRFPKALGYLGLSGSLVGSGCLMTHLIRKKNINYKVHEESDDALKKYTEEISKVSSNSIYSTYTEYESRNFYEEGLSKLTCTRKCEHENNQDKKECGCTWDGLLYDHINEEKAECIYYIKLKDKSNLRVTRQKPTRENTGIYKGWKLNKFSWKKDKKKWIDWYGYCLPTGADVKGINCGSDNLPEGWTAEEA